MASENRKTFHLFNCDKLCDLSEVESLLKAVEKKVAFRISKIVKHPLRGGQITDEVEKTIPSLKNMDYAIFVVHANECCLSFNEDTSYGKLYGALKRQAGLDDNVLLVIGGDDHYKDEDEKEKHFISDWAKKTAIARQFRANFLDGRKSFIFSWDKKHRPVHEEALMHYFDPSKKGQKFVYKPKTKRQEPNIDPAATVDIQQKEPESSLQEQPASEEEAMDSHVDGHEPSESDTQVSSNDHDVTSPSSSSSIKLKTYLRYGSISYASNDVETWDGSWRPPAREREKLKQKWKSYRLKKLTIYVDGTGKITKVEVATPTLGDYCSIS